MKGIVEDPTADVAESAGFGCAVTNRFGQLLDDEADPFDIIREAQAEKKKKKKEEAKKPAPKPVKKESQKDRRVPVSGGEGDNSAQTKTSQGQRFPSRGGGSGPAEERGERRVGFRDRRTNDNEASMGFSIERPAEQGERGTRGRGGGRGGGGRGMRGGGSGQFRSTDGFDQRGKREFERHSGSDRTGVRPEEKRGGSGPRNWGSMRDHMSAAADGAPADEGAEREEGAEPADAGANPSAEGEAEAAEPPAVEMSLDEWKALQKQSRPKAEFNIRKADTSVPSDSMVIHKSKKALEEQAEEAEEESMRRPANDITAKLEINFGSLGRPSRGARGGARGGRGRGGPIPRPDTTSPQKPPEKPRVQTRVPNPDDPEDFPALA
ncbi:intracellular hyaluronan-binding protein 4 [Osmerus eperlanus]|uniref:intracellular hyaluronan-binding protein 4 n=1 Tax=Osmerus eperlanus TaxID=29151 RepID=UPI002E0F00DD